MSSGSPLGNMNPLSYESMLSTVNAGHPSLVLDRVLNSSNVNRCGKCGFASTDAAEFKKHMLEHRGTKFYCFYCNHVSFSETELSAHLQQHCSKYPFKCPHCGQGYMRRLCLVKHIDRLHSKNISQGPAKSSTTKHPHIPVSSALSSGPTADPLLPRPAVRVTVPALSTPTARLGKDEQRGKTLDTNVSNTTNGNTGLLAPFNGHIQHNRALTVSLPEEVTIPAGCLVELVEVKTVNGTKELKLRLVSQQENTSVIKDTRTAFSQNTTLGKPLSSTLNNPNTVRSTSMGMCTVDRKQCESKAANVERPAVAAVNISKNLPTQASIEKSGLKRTSQEIINLEYHTVIPNKIPKRTLSPVREGSSGIKVTQRETVNHNTAQPSVISSRAVNRLTSAMQPENIGACVSQRVMDERNNLIPEHPKTVPPRRTSDVKILPLDASAAVKLEPGEIRLKSNTSDTSNIKKEAVGLNQQKSASPSLGGAFTESAQVRPPVTSTVKDNAVARTSFSIPRSLKEPSSLLSFKTPAPSHQTNSKKYNVWPQNVRSSERAGEGDVLEPEGFPVISSVFSLSQQPGVVQGSMQPLVMALRGIVMDKNNGSGGAADHIKTTNHTEQQAREATKICAQLATKDGSIIHNLSVTDWTKESVKAEEQDKSVQHPSAPPHNHFHVKEEKNKLMPAVKLTDSHTTASNSLKDDESVSKTAAHSNAEPLQEMAKSEHDLSSRFLTVSLKRVQVGMWKKSKKGMKLRISRCKTQVPIGSRTDCTVIHPMPLKVDQLVKRPGPNQPVVVLNHPKPRAAIQAATADTLADMDASEVAPKCQILKMRLSKVMGQKYEVMGCTVGVFP